MWRHISAVLSLFLLSPLIAEYLLGSLPMSLIAILPLMAAMYGSGAILIREIVRATGRGWPSMILLAAAYGLIEEGFVTQSLFNPNYLHLRLLDFGFVPTLGTALPWLVFVVSIHIIWSISVPIGLTEVLFRGKRAEPWLGWIGRTIFVMIFLAGSFLVAVFSYKQVPFMATPAQFGVTGAAVIALIATALLWPKARAAQDAVAAPHPVVLFAAPFVFGSVLMALQQMAQAKWHWSPESSVAAALGLEAGFIAFMVVFTRGRAWTDGQRFALMAGGLMVYVWSGFLTDVSLHGQAALVPHIAIAVVFVIICALAGWHSRAANR